MAKGSSRLISLDIFRGLTIMLMILVNTPGSWKYVYSPLRNAKWNGCTPADLIFPFFLFIVGISTYYSLRKYGNVLNWDSLLRILRRVIALFSIGLFLNIFPYFGRDYNYLRIMGVLQRIALAYGVGAIICLSVRREYLWIVLVFILLFYWGLLAIVGGANPYSLEGNFVLRTDIAILGKSHLYDGFGIPFDPEGLLSTITAVCTVIIGYYTGETIGRGPAKGQIVIKLILLGIASVGLGYLWNILFPINKYLWTSSYVLYSAGIAMVVLAIIFLIADVLKFSKWAIFFTVFGTNAILTYFIATIWTKMMLLIKVPSGHDNISLYNWIYDKVCVPVAGNMGGSLMFAILQMLIIWSFILILYRKKIMIRL